MRLAPLVLSFAFLLAGVVLVIPLQSTQHDASQCNPEMRVTNNLGAQERVQACPADAVLDTLAVLIFVMIAISFIFALVVGA